MADYADEDPYDTNTGNHPEAEQAVLGAVLLDQAVLDEVRLILHPGDFSKSEHIEIYSMMLSMCDEQVPIDEITVARRLIEAGSLKRVGGPLYLHTLVTAVPTIGNATYYARQVAEDAYARQLRVLSVQLGQASIASDPTQRDKLVGQIRDQLAPPTQADTDGTAPLEWASFLAADLGSVEWLVDPLIPAGAQISLVGAGKAGKSLLCFELAAALSAGAAVLGNNSRPPVRSMYVDQENPHSEIQRRAATTGYDDPDLLANLAYLSYPTLPPLDTAEGGRALMSRVEQHQPQLVWLDTISRMISGPENDSDTWLALYRYSLLPLRAAGIATVRLDHYGKDHERGARGSSAKTQDVDHVWELTEQPGGLLRLRRTFTRNGIGTGELILRRLGNSTERGTTRHDLVATGAEAVAAATEAQARTEIPLVSTRTLELARLLDEAGLPRNMTKNATLAEIRKHQRAGNDTAQAVMAYRRDLAPDQAIPSTADAEYSQQLLPGVAANMEIGCRRCHRPVRAGDADPDGRCPGCSEAAEPNRGTDGEE